jgi:hypothetical protein
MDCRLLDAVDLLGADAPYLVPQRIVEVASMKAGCSVAAYVLDLEGLFAPRLAGDVERFPARVRTPIGVGPEVIPEALPQLRGLVADRVGPSTLWPLSVRDRVMGFLLACDRPTVDLAVFAGQAALALELASGYTDALHAVRRRKDTKPAAEIQQNLLPPRLARVNGADVAGGVLPGYDVGGDFFDYAGNADTRTACGWWSPTRLARVTRLRRFPRWRSVRCALRAAPVRGYSKPRS